MKMNSNNTCPICTECLHNNSTTTLNCTHRFCTQCIDRWRDHQLYPRCPMCRAPNIAHRPNSRTPSSPNSRPNSRPNSSHSSRTTRSRAPNYRPPPTRSLAPRPPTRPLSNITRATTSSLQRTVNPSIRRRRANNPFNHRRRTNNQHFAHMMLTNPLALRRDALFHPAYR